MPKYIVDIYASVSLHESVEIEASCEEEAEELAMDEAGMHKYGKLLALDTDVTEVSE